MLNWVTGPPQIAKMTKSFKEIYISEEKSNSQNACQNKVEI
jgi:hypothetical protein